MINVLTSYHNHTARCNHAEGSEEEYILHAIKHGYEEFGFSDHAPHCFNEALSGSRMTPDELPLYVADITRLKEKYASDIKIRIGLELEYYPYYHKLDMESYRAAGIEYLILGQHLVGYREPGVYRSSFGFTSKNEDYTAYVDQCIEGLRLGCFSYFAHPDVFKYKGDDDFYRAESDRLIITARELGIPLEFNLYGMIDNRNYPNPLFWERVGALGAKAVIGRDAHKVSRVHDDNEIAMALAFADKYKLDLIDRIGMPEKI